MSKTYTKAELEEILTKHKRWLDSTVDGARANLSFADLRSANNLEFSFLNYWTLPGRKRVSGEMKRTPEEKKLRDESATPDWLFEIVRREFNPTLDVCANERNAKCRIYIAEATNALDTDKWATFDTTWKGHTTAWMNPPYSDPYPWCKKAYKETREPGFRVVALLKLDPSTKWWCEFVVPGCTQIRLIEKRIGFTPAPGIKFSTNNFCNVLAVFERSEMPPVIYSWRV